MSTQSIGNTGSTPLNALNSPQPAVQLYEMPETVQAILKKNGIQSDEQWQLTNLQGKVKEINSKLMPVEMWNVLGNILEALLVVAAVGLFFAAIPLAGGVNYLFILLWIGAALSASLAVGMEKKWAISDVSQFRWEWQKCQAMLKNSEKMNEFVENHHLETSFNLRQLLQIVPAFEAYSSEIAAKSKREAALESYNNWSAKNVCHDVTVTPPTSNQANFIY
ncbi:MAG: hypothetical protein KGJ02_00545 [Verrucomicrobiota bacterium]|nr:hypothetical protein [Verrucomicrobiota bacterium]